jgi:hypothetical protein
MTDVERLIRVLHRLVDAGHSVVLIEHNLDVIANVPPATELGGLAEIRRTTSPRSSGPRSSRPAGREIPRWNQGDPAWTCYRDARISPLAEPKTAVWKLT